MFSLTIIHGIIRFIIIFLFIIVLDHGSVCVIVTEYVRLAADVLLIHSPVPVHREDVLVEDDEVLDELVDQVLVDHLVSVCWYGHQSWSEANGKIVWIHHVLITEIILL